MNNRNAQKKLGVFGEKSSGLYESQFDVPCVNPRAQDGLVAYISGEMESSEAAEVEDHMLACRSCRGFFMTMHGVRAEARASAPTEEAPKVARLGDFKKRSP